MGFLENIILYYIKVNCDKNFFSIYSVIGFKSGQTANQKKNILIVKLICLGNMAESDASSLSWSQYTCNVVKKWQFGLQ